VSWEDSSLNNKLNTTESVGLMELKVNFALDEINILDIKEYPVKILYEQEGVNLANILIFESKEKLERFIHLRKYMLDRMDPNGRKPGKIRLFE
jgi:hypothetical protein